MTRSDDSTPRADVWLSRLLLTAAAVLLLFLVVIGAVAWFGSERALNPSLVESN